MATSNPHNPNSRSQREEDGKHDRFSGWQAQIVGPPEGGDQPGAVCPLVTDRAEADRIAASVGCTVEQEEDAANGLWLVRVSPEALQALDEDEWWDGTSTQGSVLVECP